MGHSSEVLSACVAFLFLFGLHFWVAPLIQSSSDQMASTSFAIADTEVFPLLGKVCVVLPAYNEAEGLPSLLGKIQQVFEQRRQEYQVVVVDDASTDDTSAVAQKAAIDMPIQIVRHAKNRGLSGALETGLRTAVDECRPGDVVVTLDADDTQPPATIDRMLLMIAEGYDVVIASRYQPGSRVIGVPWNRRLMTVFARYLFKSIMPIEGVRDYTCGFRAYRLEVLQKGLDHYGDEFVSEKGFSCMVDVLLKLRRFRFVMGEVPMLLRYDQKFGPSKMQVSNTAVTTIQLLLKRRWAGY